MRWTALVPAAAVLFFGARARAQAVPTGEPPAPASAPPSAQAAPTSEPPAQTAAPDEPPPPAATDEPPPPAATDEPPPPPARAPAPARAVNVKGSIAFGLDAALGPLGGEQDAGVVYFGLDFRLGYRFDIGPLFVVPEAVAGVVVLTGHAQHLDMLHLGGGLRAGARIWRFEPALYGHVYELAAVQGGSLYDVDAGAALDVRITPSFSLGAHGGLNWVQATPLFGTLGVQGTLLIPP
jgi:hypothetical protein